MLTVNVVRLLLGGLVALFALGAALFAALVVALATAFGLLARALGLSPAARPRRPAGPATHRRPPPNGHGEIIDVVATEVTNPPPTPKS